MYYLSGTMLDKSTQELIDDNVNYLTFILDQFKQCTNENYDEIIYDTTMTHLDQHYDFYSNVFYMYEIACVIESKLKPVSFSTIEHSFNFVINRIKDGKDMMYKEFVHDIKLHSKIGYYPKLLMDRKFCFLDDIDYAEIYEVLSK